jgi:hypothetical protein
MTKKQLFYTVIFASVTILCSSFKTAENRFFPWFHVIESNSFFSNVPTESELDQTFYNIPFVGKTFIGFKQTMGVRESQGKYDKINTLGYLGKYQFGTETLRTLGIKNTEDFLKSPKLQENAFLANLAKNKWELRTEISKYSGKTISNVEITESGILAAAHLGGAGSVKRFLKTNGRKKCSDGYGTSVKNYMNDFAGYDTSCIEANQNAKAREY